MTGSIITDPDHIALFRKVTLHKMLGLEMKGIKRRGRSAYSIIKSEFNYRGSRQKVFDLMAVDLREEGAVTV